MALIVAFLGSPTVRIDGLDIEPSARQRTDFGMMCRRYKGSGGVPSEDLIHSAITAAHQEVCERENSDSRDETVSPQAQHRNRPSLGTPEVLPGSEEQR